MMAGLLPAWLLEPGPDYAAQQLDSGSTVDQPLAYARGVEHVLVNGTPVVDTGEHTAARPGRNLLRAS